MSQPDADARAWGEVLGVARVAQRPADFQVEEILGFRASGEGPHLLVAIEKTGLSTTEAIKTLARHWGCSPREVGYAGRKDRQAVTRQWISVPWPIKAELPETGPILSDSGAQRALSVRSVARHRRKLPVGALTGNRFILTLRGVSAPPVKVNQRLSTIARCGVPNYFGGQRFGRDAENLGRVRAWFAGEISPRGRADRSMLLSTARSACFNRVLSDRVQLGDWASPSHNDLLVLDGRGSLFAAAGESTSRLAARAAGLRIHPTGPLPGKARNGLVLNPELMAREAEALSSCTDLVDGLVQQGVEMARRALRLAVGGLAWHWQDEGVLQLRFHLPKGSYATSVLRELVDWEVSDQRRSST